ncbi:MAG: hypothetical protein JXA16_00515 [Bacteroidales bacterium]|nr:hypothetical protein [Bacteroidales bacterium]
MKPLSKLLIFIFIFTFSINTNAQKEKNAWLNGEWRGTGFQLNNSDSWSIHFIANTKKSVYEIKYSSLGCSGIWQLLSVNNHLAQFQETITEGISKCLSGGIIIITKVDNQHITFTYFTQSGKLDSFSTLEKTEFK